MTRRPRRAPVVDAANQTHSRHKPVAAVFRYWDLTARPGLRGPAIRRELTGDSEHELAEHAHAPLCPPGPQGHAGRGQALLCVVELLCSLSALGIVL
jgi:hypothetical protein